MRRTLLIIAALIVLVGIGVIVYFYFFNGAPSISVSHTTTLPSAGNATSSTSSGNSGSSGSSSGSTAPTPTPATERLVQIDAGPIAPGEIVTDAMLPSVSTSTPATPDTRVSFIERQSGNIFSYSTEAGIVTRTSNRTVPGIEEASWLSDASAAIVRYLSGDDFSTVNTYALPANGSTGAFLPQDIADLSISSLSVLTVASGVNGSVGTVMHADGSGASQVFATPLSSIRASFAGKNQYLVFTKPSATEDGYAFLVDSKGNFSQVAGPLKGLVALASPSGKSILVSYVDGGAMKMELVEPATAEVIALPLGTLADKCVWTADEAAIYCGVPQNPPTSFAYPDDWYQGAVHFSDRIWKIDVPGRFAQLVLDFTNETKVSLDATDLAVDPEARTLAFFNKNDGSLWSYQLQ